MSGEDWERAAGRFCSSFSSPLSTPSRTAGRDVRGTRHGSGEDAERREGGGRTSMAPHAGRWISMPYQHGHPVLSSSLFSISISIRGKNMGKRDRLTQHVPGLHTCLIQMYILQ